MADIAEVLKRMGLPEEDREAILEEWEATKEAAIKAAEEKVRSELLERHEAEMEAMTKAVSEHIEGKTAEVLGESVEKLKRRIKELEEQKALQEKHQEILARKIQKIVEKRLGEEMEELSKDVERIREESERRIRNIKEGYKRKYEDVISRSAFVLKDIAERKINKIMDPLVEDVRRARENDFGRRIFEAMRAEFRSQFANTNEEFRKLTERNQKLESMMKRVIAESEAREKAYKDEVRKILKENEDLKSKINLIQEKARKEKLMERYLVNFSGPQRRALERMLHNADPSEYAEITRDFLMETQDDRFTKKTRKRIIEDVDLNTDQDIEYDDHDDLFDGIESEIDRILR